MALACARCGAQNPDGNLFCSTCGNPLTAAAAAPPVAAPGWAAAAPPAAAPVHRTPWTLIIAAVVGLIVVMAGCGTAVALLTNKASITGGITSDLPSPTPAGSPSPLASPPATAGPRP